MVNFVKYKIDCRFCESLFGTCIYNRWMKLRLRSSSTWGSWYACSWNARQSLSKKWLLRSTTNNKIGWHAILFRIGLLLYHEFLMLRCHYCFKYHLSWINFISLQLICKHRLSLISSLLFSCLLLTVRLLMSYFIARFCE